MADPKLLNCPQYFRERGGVFSVCGVVVGD